MASVTTVAAVYSLGATALAVGLMVLLHFLEPEFDPSWRMLSEYSLGRYGVLMRAAFLAMGTAVIAVAVALWGTAGLWSLGLIFVAIGPLGAAFIDTDPITTPRAQMSRRSNIHAALGSLFILGFPLAATLAGIGAADDPTVGPVLAWASIVSWITLVWFIGTSVRHTRPDAVGGPEVRVGWPNRVNILADLGWVALAAVTLLR
jgi:Protein of unknown function (DUF998)